MALHLIERHWDALSDRILREFSQIDGAALKRFEGRVSAFVEHLAQMHDLTRQEAVATLEERVLIPARLPLDPPANMAAE